MRFITSDFGGAGAGVSNKQRCIPLTVLRRPEGMVWRPIEVAIMCTHLETHVVGDPRYPEYLIIRGHYSPEKTFPTIGFRSQPHTVLLTSGPESKDIPFVPRII